VMTAGSTLAAVLLALWAHVESLGGLYALWIGLGLALAGILYEPVFAVITLRFPDSYQTRITALTLVGGFASTLFVPLTEWAIEALGWREALSLLAACNLLLCIPVHAWALGGGGSLPSAGAPRHSPRAGPGEDTVRRALRSPVFWSLAVSFTGYYTAFSALSFHLVPLLSDRAMPMATVIAAVALIGPSQVAGRIALLTLRGSLSARGAGRVATLILPAGILLELMLPDSSAALFGFVILLGVANGIITIVRGTAVPQLMWREGYGAINGMLSLPANVARGAAPWGAALLWSMARGYDAVLWAAFAACCMAAAAFWVASSPRAARPDAAP